jgi:hypothetical protein
MSDIVKMRTVQPWYTQGGVTHFTRYECATWFRDIATSEEYRENFKRRWLSGTLPPALEVLALHYAFGKPTEHVNLNVQSGPDFSQLSTAELLERVEALNAQLREAETLERELCEAVKAHPDIDVEAKVV